MTEKRKDLVGERLRLAWGVNLAAVFGAGVIWGASVGRTLAYVIGTVALVCALAALLRLRRIGNT